MHSKTASTNNDLVPIAPSSVRIAWMMPTLARGYYWQPVFRKFAEHFPNTKIYAGIWPGYLPGLEGTFNVQKFNGGRVVGKRRKKRFIWTPPSVIWNLIRHRPKLIFTSGFHLGTAYLLALKPLIGWRVVLLWEGIGTEIAQLDNPLRLRLRRYMAKCFDFAISNTFAGAEYLTGIMGMPPLHVARQLYEVPDRGVLSSQLTANDTANKLEPKRPGHTVFLYVGTLCREKGTHKLLESCGILVKRGIINFSCVLIGDGYLAPEFPRLARELGIIDQVIQVGQIRYEALGPYFREADVFVFPSFEDTWGMVVLEAMAVGKPILCSKYAGSKELIRNGENGFVFDPHDSTCMADHMERFIWDKDSVIRMGLKSIEAIEPYTPKRSANMLAGVASQVLRTGRSVLEDVSLPGSANAQFDEYGQS